MTEPQVASVDIGELLSSKRHQRNENIPTVAGNTKLSSDMIKKLESNQFDEVGTPVYVRGYLGIYAKYLGLDAAFVIEQYNAQFPAEEIAIRPSAGQSLEQRRHQSKRHSKTVSFLTAGLFFCGLVYGYTQIEPVLLSQAALLGEDTDKPRVDNQLDVTGEDKGSGSNKLDEVIGEVTAAQNLADDALNGVPITRDKSLVSALELDLAISPTVAAAENDLTLSANSQEGQSGQAQGDQRLSVELTVASNASSSGNSGSEPSTDGSRPNEAGTGASRDGASQTRAGDTATATTQATASQKLVLTFTADCWVQITDGDNKRLAANIYSTKRRIDVTGKAPLTMRLGNPSAVSSATFNGSAISLADYSVSKMNYRLPK